MFFFLLSTHPEIVRVVQPTPSRQTHAASESEAVKKTKKKDTIKLCILLQGIWVSFLREQMS